MLPQAGIIGQNVAVQEHPLLAGQTKKTPPMKTQKMLQYAIMTQEKELIQCQKISNSCLQSTLHIP